MPVAIMLALGACKKAPPPNPQWVLHGKLVFMSEDLTRERAPLPHAMFRLFFPYIAGDIYGAPTTGDFINATVDAEYRFAIDLNRDHRALLASLEPTQLSLAYLHIEPSDARVARLAPTVLQADGIEPVGRAQWVDDDTRQPLLLLYFDRPAKLIGETAANGRRLRYDIEAPAAGYVWVGRSVEPDEESYEVTPQPPHLLLAVTPLPADVSKASSRAGRGIPAP